MQEQESAEEEGTDQHMSYPSPKVRFTARGVSPCYNCTTMYHIVTQLLDLRTSDSYRFHRLYFRALTSNRTRSIRSLLPDSTYQHLDVMSATNDLAMQPPSTPRPQLPLELWHAIFQYLRLPSGKARLIRRHGSPLEFDGCRVDREAAPALMCYDCLFPGSAQAVWDWVMRHTAWIVVCVADADALRSLELDIGVSIKHVDIRVHTVQSIMETMAETAVLVGLQSLCVEMVVYHERAQPQLMAGWLEIARDAADESLAIICCKMGVVMPQWVYDCEIVPGVHVNRVSRVRLEMGKRPGRTLSMH